MTLPRSSAPELSAISLAALDAVTDGLCRGAREVLHDNFLGAYLVGSFALGAGDDHSDVDFLVVTRARVDAEQESALRALHGRLPDGDVHWAQHLEGSYVHAAQLRRVGRPPARWLYVDNGSREMQWSSHDDTAVLRWVVLAGGIDWRGRVRGRRRYLGARSRRRPMALADPARDRRPISRPWAGHSPLIRRVRRPFTADQPPVRRPFTADQPSLGADQATVRRRPAARRGTPAPG